MIQQKCLRWAGCRRSGAMILLGFSFAVAFLFTLSSLAQAQTTSAATPGQRQLKINEFMASNSSVLEDPQAPGKFPDWLEIYNPTDAPVSLDGLYLVNGDLADPIRFAITDGLTVPAKGFLVFFADNDLDQGPLHTNFRLNKDGDRIGLYADLAATDEIDARAFGQQTTDYSEGREPDGGPTWRQFSQPTPLRKNTAQAPLIRDVTHSPELPTSSQAVRVSATISDDGPILSVSLIYSITAGATISVPMSTSNGETYTGQIPAQPSGSIVHYYVRAVDREGEFSPDPSLARIPYQRYPVDYDKPTVVINEVMADNGLTLEDPDDAFNYPDWIELYNYGTAPVRLGGLYLSDKLDNPDKFALDESLVLAPKSFMLFYADEQPEQGVKHTNFRLERNGESVGLFGAMGSVLIDHAEYTDLYEDVAYGRYPDGAQGEQQLLFCPSPGRANVACDQQIHLPAIAKP